MNNRDQKLSDLDNALIEALLAKIREGRATPADLNVARQLLKDNDFQVLPEANPNIMRLAKELPFGPEAEAG